MVPGTSSDRRPLPAESTLLLILFLVTTACVAERRVEKIEVDAVGVLCFKGDKPGPLIRWSRLARVEIRTRIDKDYVQPYFVITEAEGSFCEFRTEVGSASSGLLDRLARLPSFNYEALVAAGDFDDARSTTLWQGQPGDGLAAAERIVLTPVGVQRHLGDQLVDEARWSEIVEVSVETTNRGPFFVDLFLVLVEADGSTLRLPSDLFTEALLVDRIFRLPGFDLQAFLKAQASTENARFVCWRKEADANSERFPGTVTQGPDLGA